MKAGIFMCGLAFSILSCPACAEAAASEGGPSGSGVPAKGSLPLLDAIAYARSDVRLLSGGRIIGGQVAPSGAYPWQVALLAAEVSTPNKGFFCGGSFIGGRWIVTAAHCVDRGTQAQHVDVLVNTQELSSGGQRMKLSRIAVHPRWNPETNDNDIALLKTADAISGTAVRLISSTDAVSLKPGAKVTVAGWGRTQEGGSISEKLKQLLIPIVAREVCNDRVSYSGRVTKNMLCAGLQEGGADSCQGDSGGSLTLALQETRVLVGVVSWGEGCARPDKYGVYTDVAKYRGWIRKTAKY